MESLLDQEKLKNQENQQAYHKNEKLYLKKISQLESDTTSKEKLANEFKAKSQVYDGKIQNLVEQLNEKKAENLILKEERDDIKNQNTEEIRRLRDDVSKKSKKVDNLRNDFAKAKDDKIRFENSLKNKDSEVTRLQMQLDREKGKI